MVQTRYVDQACELDRTYVGSKKDSGAFAPPELGE